MSVWRCRWLLFVGLVVCCSGCLINSRSTRIVEADAERIAISFENDQAMQLFQQTVRDRYRREKNVGDSDFGIPLLVSIHEQRILSENAHYNRQVDKADANHDGWITLAEATAYSQ